MAAVFSPKRAFEISPVEALSCQFLGGMPPGLFSALQIAERCQIGRGTVWGLGRFELSEGREM